MEINQRAREKDTPCRVIAEMGGKNAIIDNTADLDHAIPGVLASPLTLLDKNAQLVHA